MKIKIITQNFPPRIGGIQNVMYSLANNFSDLGHDVHVIPDHYYLGNDKFKITNLYFPKLLRPIAKKIYLSFLNDENHLVLCDTWKSVKAVPKKYKNIVVFAHGQEYLNYKKNKYRISKSLAKSKFLIASSNYTLNLIKKSWDISNLSARVIYPTYHIKKIKSMYKPKENNERINFISVCRIEKRKGLFQSLKSLKVVLDKGYDFKWDIIGDGPYLKTLINETSKLNLEKNIRFHGRMDKNTDIEKILIKSDIFLMPTFQDNNSIEGFGLSYIEAAKYGVPSIAGNTGGASEAVINNKTGWCVDACNKENLINTIIESINNSNKRKDYGSSAFKRFQEELNSNIVTNQLIDFIIK